MAWNDNPWGDNGPAAKAAPEPRRLGGPSTKLTDRMGDKLDSTKEVASAGLEKTKVAAKKVKDGASNGVNWVKLKYSKQKIFQKK